jgi:D-tyrosyl-tRNA(Tyr) deacylase
MGIAAGQGSDKIGVGLILPDPRDCQVRIVLQRVTSASVEVDGEIVAQIGQGLLALIGVGHGDDERTADWLADKTVELRVFADLQGKMNRSLIDVGGAVLAVSQFTLLGDCRKGRRPAFTDAAAPELANRLYLHYATRIAARGIQVARGVFGADMQVSLVNDGPVTMIIDRPSANATA